MYLQSALITFSQPPRVHFASQEHRQVGDSPSQGQTSIRNGPPCWYQPGQAPNKFLFSQRLRLNGVVVPITCLILLKEPISRYIMWLPSFSLALPDFKTST